MMVKIVRRTPTALEFESLLVSVGFRGHDPASTELALANTLFCICAMDEKEVIGLGRIVGDGAISLLLTNIMVRPSYQRRGIGTRIRTGAFVVRRGIAAQEYRFGSCSATWFPGILREP
jgi:GNAT superfamily N-acetyltransferase